MEQKNHFRIHGSIVAALVLLAGCASGSGDGQESTAPVREGSEDQARAAEHGSEKTGPVEGTSENEATDPKELALIEIGAARFALTGTHKLCSIYVPGNWRDTVVVPNGWSRTRCATDWRAHNGATTAVLGCLTNGTFSFAALSGTAAPPDNSCGW
jgi:hypothetical protein